MNKKFQNKIVKMLIAISLFILPLISIVSISQAQTATPTANISSTGFRLLVCDGPVLPPNYTPKPTGTYTPCDFKGLMMQVQHFIDIAMVLGVLVALAGFTWAGALYITGEPGKISQAHEIFPKIVEGFVIMICGWFIVYQLLFWLTGANTFSILLGGK